jgi:phosphohistidine phosphatase SixA
MIEKVIFVRHGHYDKYERADQRLSEHGIQAVRLMAPAIRRAFGGMPDLFITSPALRARQTAGMLSEELDCPRAVPSEVLRRDILETELQEELPLVHEELVHILGRATRALICTHEPVGTFYPPYFAFKALTMRVRPIRLDLAQASCLDATTRTFELIKTP